VRRLVSIVVHNWPLKLAAVGLAVLLYVGLVLAQNSKEWRGQVPVEIRNQPSNAVLLGGVQYVTSIRYFSSTDVAGRVTSESFTAYVDLSPATADSSNDIAAAVAVTSPDPAVRVLDWAPRQISIRLDPLRAKTVPVQVDKGTVPPGLEVREPLVDPTQVSITGTQSSVSQVVAAVARVRIDPSGVSVDQQVDLVAVDARGEPVSQIRIDPASVRVRILIGSQLQSRSLPINPVVTGTPADGFQVGAVTVEPLIVTVEGDAETLAALNRIDTAPVSVSGAAKDVMTTVGIVLPAGVNALGQDQVNVTARINAIAGTRTFSVGPVLSGARDDRRYALSTDQVLVTIGGSAATLAGLSGDRLVATADVTGLGPGSHDVALKVTPPVGTTLVVIAPARITVTITAVPAAAPPSPSPS
jgi:YbbR domain-containing protein